ncbi:MAG: hypothetical protein ACK5LV_03550 [Lachnospirales bacterium]
MQKLNLFENLSIDSKKQNQILILITILVALFLYLGKTNDTNIVSDYDDYDEVSVKGDTYFYYENQLESKLEEVLTKVEGAGKVEVLITLAKSSERVIAKNTNSKMNETTEEKEGETKSTIDEEVSEEVIFNSKQEETPFIVYDKSPEIEGVLIVAEGGDNVILKDSFVRTTESLLGISSYKISVLKMQK